MSVTDVAIVRGRLLEELAGLRVRDEERLHLRPEFRLTRAFPIQQHGAFSGVRQLKRCSEQFFGRLGHESVDALGDKLD